MIVRAVMVVLTFALMALAVMIVAGFLYAVGAGMHGDWKGVFIGLAVTAAGLWTAGLSLVIIGLADRPQKRGAEMAQEAQDERGE